MSMSPFRVPRRCPMAPMMMLRVLAAIIAITLGGGLALLPRLAGGQDARPAAPPTADAGFEKRAQQRQETIEKLVGAGKVAEAVAPSKALYELRKQHQGDASWQTGDARRRYETLQRIAAQPVEVQEQYVKALQSHGRGGQLYSQGKYSEA